MIETDIEARIRRVSPSRGKASVRILFDRNSSMTVSNISVWENAGKINVKMPPMGTRPDVTFTGDLKRQVEAAIRQQFRCSAPLEERCVERAAFG